MPGHETRALALRTLIDYERRDAYLGVLLSSRLEQSGLDRRDRALVVELVQGTVRMKLTLDWALKGFSNQPLDALEPGVIWALRLAAYQVMFTSVPDYAAVDMAAASTSRVTGRHAVGYVNAVMRAFVRGLKDVTYPDRASDPEGYLEAKYSHPRWVVRMWIEELGFEKAEAICAGDNADPHLAVRTNLLRVTREALSSTLKAKEIHVEPGGLTPEALLIKGSGPVGDLEEFRAGFFAVQDQGSQLVSHQVCPEPGMRVLDICAAPGGKANHMAELMRNEGSVLALDMNARRLKLVTDTAERLGNTIVEAVELDATKAGSSIPGVFDRVLVDAPCSGLGTLARRPDARWRKKPEDVDRLASLQSELLSEGARLVAPGGLLVYSTCTISARENEGVAGGFVRSSDESFVSVAPSITDSERTPFMQLFPDADGCDGMFVAVMRRVS